MGGTRAAIRYAKAILSLASDQKAAEAVNNDMKLIAKTISENSNLELALKNAVVKLEAKNNILTSLFSNIHPITKNLFDLLVVNKRIDIIEEIAKKYTVLFDELNGKQKAIVTTAIPMTNDLEMKVLAKVKELTNKAVQLENIVDEKILGGFILRVGDIQYNASISSKLNRLKREFTLN
jgi:F-type H+-transporting ATPase subunit delta